jgi:hypothetical protein
VSDVDICRHLHNLIYSQDKPYDVVICFNHIPAALCDAALRVGDNINYIKQLKLLLLLIFCFLFLFSVIFTLPP